MGVAEDLRGKVLQGLKRLQVSGFTRLDGGASVFGGLNADQLKVVGQAQIGQSALIPPQPGAAPAPTLWGSLPVKIDEIGPITVAQATMAFPTVLSVLPTGFRHLDLRLVSRGTLAAVNGEIILRFNGDSTAGHYAYQRLSGTGAAAASSFNGGGSDGIRFLFTPSASAFASTPGLARYWIPLYNQTTFNKVVEGSAGPVTAATLTAIECEIVQGVWASTQAITTLALTLSGNTFDVGSYAELWGWP